MRGCCLRTWDVAMPTQCPKPLLSIQNLCAGYGQSRVLQGVNLQIAPGELVALLGRNGSGRSTLARAVMGLVLAQGRITWGDRDVLGMKTFEIARLGIGYVPEHRDVFADLTVTQNLKLGIKPGAKPARWSIDDIFTLFPQLKVRAGIRAGVLSGGEQQMLSLCRTLMGDPTLIIVDEPTEGLAPQLVETVANFLKTLRSQGIAILLIEQKLRLALSVAERCVVMGRGQIIFDGRPDELRQNRSLHQEWLQV